MSQPLPISASFPMSYDVKTFGDLVFPIQGRSLPADHNYGLYAALVHLSPAIREQSDLRILTIPGLSDGEGKIALSDFSCMRIRVPLTKLPLVYPFAGKRLTIGIHPIAIGSPTMYGLKPASSLKARIVVIKGYMQVEEFLGAAQRQLDALEIKGELSIPLDPNGQPNRKTIKVKTKTIVGFTVKVTGLSDENSLKLQQQGLGGKGHMGCGYFIPQEE